jgi:DNA-binding NtrC family response regulator
LRQHRKSSFSIVLTDIAMPDGDGFELIKAIRKESPQTYIIAMSGGGPMSMETCLRIASHMGAHCILEKPFSTSDLLEAISKATASPKS